MYDYLIVGAGLYGAVCARQAKEQGKSVLVIDKRSHIAGNVYTEEVEGIQVHKYGAHIFHTNNRQVWEYVNRFARFNRFTNSPVANYHGELYSLPFNMYTFNKMWGVVTPQEAADKIEEQKKAAGITEPKNLEEQAISLVGTDIYEKLVKGYTEKQWGRPCTELPAFIIRRLPVRFTFDNNYFNALYQGIPEGGYTTLVAAMLDGIEVRLGVDYLEKKEELTRIYTGQTGSASSLSSKTAGPLAGLTAGSVSSSSLSEKEESAGKQDWKAQKEEQARLRKRQNDLKKTEEAILNHETRMEEIDQLLASEEVYTNVSRLMELNQEKETLTRQLEELYEAWESLAE